MTDDRVREEHPDMNPMIDVVFQLLIFFLVTMKFKTLDMKIDAFLPKDRGLAKTITKIDEKPKAVAVLRRKRGERVTRIKFQNVQLGTTQPSQVRDSWRKLTAKAEAIRSKYISTGGNPDDVVGEVDASQYVPTGDVVRAVDAFIAAGIKSVTFVGTPPPGSTLDQLQNQ